MSTAFQAVIDNAESIAFNKRKKVSQTISREGVVRSVSLGGQVWEIEVSLPNGPSWETWRPLVEKIDNLDMVSTGTIQINKAGLSWINGYQGNLSTTTGIIVSYTSGTTLTITSSTAIASGFKFKSGDLIQLGSGGKVYSIVEDVPFNSNTITVHRPVRESSGTYTLIVGQNVTWTVICTNMPTWSLIGRNQIGWNGSFIFSEVI